jgi:hypothetical protein
MGRGQPALRSFRKKCRAGWLRWPLRNRQGKKGLVSKKEASAVRTMKQPTRRRWLTTRLNALAPPLPCSSSPPLPFAPAGPRIGAPRPAGYSAPRRGPVRCGPGALAGRDRGRA